MARKKKTETNSVSSPEPQVQENSVEALPKVQPLTDEERARLSKYEATFQKLEEIVDDAVNGLIDIRDNRLYRETHDTFELYCNEKLHITRRQADRLIAAFPIQKALADAGLPKLNEGAIREVADLPPADAVKVIQTAKDENPDGKLTAEKVRETRERVQPKLMSRKEWSELNEHNGDGKKPPGWNFLNTDGEVVRSADGLECPVTLTVRSDGKLEFYPEISLPSWEFKAKTWRAEVTLDIHREGVTFITKVARKSHKTNTLAQAKEIIGRLWAECGEKPNGRRALAELAFCRNLNIPANRKI